jgi:phosphate butyryltransferase
MAIVAAQDEDILLASHDAWLQSIATPILIGNIPQVESLASDLDVDLSPWELVHRPDALDAAREAVELVRAGRADMMVKGALETRHFLRAALDRQRGLRSGHLLTHVGVFELPSIDRLLLLSDSGVVIAPSLEQKVQIVRNAIFLARCLGIEQPKVAVLAATEMVNPNIPATLDAANLAKMGDRGQIAGALIDGPLALDNAISLKSSRVKGISSPVAGCADILICPDIEAGNVLGKAMTYFAGGKMAGVVVGASAPLVMASRSDPRQTKLFSMALGAVLASRSECLLPPDPSDEASLALGRPPASESD